jgi:pyrroline-5-carboxylate reductase
MKRKINIGIIGFGNMGRAFGRALAKVGNYNVFAYDKVRIKTKGARGIRIFSDAPALVQKAEVVILAIKPQDVESFLCDNKKYLLEEKPLFISIAAGISIKTLEKYLNGVHIIRIMPNLAAVVNESISFLAKGRFANKSDLAKALRIFSHTGEAIVIAENYLDKVTAISGSGPAYVFYFMLAMYESALKLGFKKEDARRMVIKTFEGSIKLAKEAGKELGTLIQEVTSKRGTTQAALGVFKANKLNKIIAGGITAAYRRAGQISKKNML